MTETKKSGSLICRCLCKRTLAVLTVLCAVGGVMYVTGIGKQIHEAIEKIINSQQKAHFQRRRYGTKFSRGFEMFSKHLSYLFAFLMRLVTKQTPSHHNRF